MTTKFNIYLLLALLITTVQSDLYGQSFSKTKPKIGVTAESYGLGIDNFGILNVEGKEILDIKQIKYGDKISMAFYNVTGFELQDGMANLRLTMTVVNLSENSLMVTSQTLLDEAIKPETLKDDYIYGYLTMTTDFNKGKSYLLRLHLWDKVGGKGIDMVWKFKANFK